MDTTATTPIDSTIKLFAGFKSQSDWKRPKKILEITMKICSTNQLLTTLLALVLAWPTATTLVIGQDLPSGESVVQKHIEIAGGQAAFDKIENRYFKATMEIMNAGIEFEIETFAAKPNKLLVVLEADAIGKVEQGVDGEIAWSLSDMQGPVIEEGVALENKLRDSLFDRIIYWKQAYQSAECKAIETIDGREYFKVVFTPKPYKSENSEGAEPSILIVYFDKETYLPGKIESNVVTEAGTIDVVAYLSDYKTVDDIKIPHKTQVELAGQTRVMTIESVKHNQEFPTDRFDPPKEILELLEKNQSK